MVCEAFLLLVLALACSCTTAQAMTGQVTSLGRRAPGQRFSNGK